MMQAAEDSAVSALAALEPFGYAGDGGGAKACLLHDSGVGDGAREHESGLEARSALCYLGFGQQIAQKAARFGIAAYRAQCSYQLRVFGLVPVHRKHFSKLKYIVKNCIQGIVG